MILNAISTLKTIFPAVLLAAVPTSGVGHTGSMEEWLRILVFVLGLALLVKNLFGKKPTTPQPLIIESLKKKANHEDVEKLREEVINRFDQERGIARTSQSNVHKRIDELSTNISEMKGEVKGIGSNVDRLVDKLM